MQRSLTMQIVLIMCLALVLAIANNLRPSAHIKWVRHWQPYSKVANSETPAQTTTQNTETAPALDPAQLEAATADRVTANSGITDIGLDEAYNIFRYARDFTLWIDARSPELYEEGHIKSALLLHLYEKNTYLPQIMTVIEEQQPVSLVVYCKGLDCTDSHHLAEDLAAQGYANIFVYTGGFDEWYQAGYPIEGTLAANDASESTPEISEETGPDEGQIAAVMDRVTTNAGITDIELNEAADIYNFAAEITLWIDARSPELYAEGHISGAQLLYFYDMSTYMDQVKQAIEEKQPVALVVYCKGLDCTDSHHLAEDLLAQGFENIFVYRGGFQEWYEAGYAIEGTLASNTKLADAGLDKAPVKREALEKEKPAGMYLEHILRDMIPFLFGMVLLLMWSKVHNSRTAVFAAALFAGGFFIYAAIPKLAIPMLFAKNIWNYDIVPGVLVNISALILPTVELTIAVCMITGTWRRGGSLIMSALLVIFIIAVGYNVYRGHNFDCGCTASEPYFPDFYITGWNDKYTLILRDLGLLAMALLVFFKKEPQKAIN